jgi:hypothetical protein
MPPLGDLMIPQGYVPQTSYEADCPDANRKLKGMSRGNWPRSIEFEFEKGCPTCGEHFSDGYGPEKN